MRNEFIKKEVGRTLMVNFEREKEWWDAKASKEEIDNYDELINRELVWGEINRYLKEDVGSILAIGAGTGRFSIPLAERGFEVVHLDFSSEMLKIAKSKSKGLENINFVEVNAVDLSQFGEKSFDLVLNMDGVISFCGTKAESTISESCRVTKKTLIITI